MNNVIYGKHDDATIAQFERCLAAGSAVGGVLCADGHRGYNHPIGGVVGYTDHISISGVGFDIGCGNLAVKLELPFEELRNKLKYNLELIQKTISFGVGRVNNEKVDHELFDSPLWEAAGVADLKPLAEAQLGTVGSGNHYVDLFEDTAGFTWIGVHFGSRGLGHKITTKYLGLAGAKDTMDDPPALLEAASDLGQGYYAGIKLGGWYAEAGRQWVVEKVRQLLGGAAVLETVHNHHNYCWEETHFGVKQYVVRKGATPAFPGQKGFVGGSMGDNAVILEGIESEESAKTMYSTVHGAGRVMGRLEAKGKLDRKTGEVKRAPRISKEDWLNWIREFGVQVLGSDVDEAPQAYRRLEEVLSYHKNTVRVLEVLTPRGVIMAGANEFDPYKD